jgi:hypothetical protein
MKLSVSIAKNPPTEGTQPTSFSGIHKAHNSSTGASIQ